MLSLRYETRFHFNSEGCTNIFGVKLLYILLYPGIVNEKNPKTTENKKNRVGSIFAKVRISLSWKNWRWLKRVIQYQNCGYWMYFESCFQATIAFLFSSLQVCWSKKKIENCCNRPTLDIIISLVINTAANNLILQLQSLYHDQIRDQDITKLHSEWA